MNKHKQPSYISLFSGCGGFDEGFEQAGYECLGAFDNDPVVLDVFRANLSGPAYLHNLSESQLPINYKPGEIDVIVSGSPCQGFSTAGLREINDPRNILLLVGGHITIKLKPKIFVAENVMGSLSGPHKEYWNQLQAILSANGYHVQILKCDGTELGLAQTRKRLFMIAWIGDPNKTLKMEGENPKTLKDVLKDVEKLPNQSQFLPIKNKKIQELIYHIKPGQKLCNVRGGPNSVHTWNIPSVYGKVSDQEKAMLILIKDLRRKIRIRKTGDADPVTKADLQKYSPVKIDPILDSLVKKGYIKNKEDRFDLIHSFNGLYRRLEWDKPAFTVDTRFGNPRYFLHPDEMRGFTVREAARIQGFRDSFIFKGSIAQQYKMIGNAVPPPMANKVARMIKELLIHE